MLELLNRSTVSQIIEKRRSNVFESHPLIDSKKAAHQEKPVLKSSFESFGTSGTKLSLSGTIETTVVRIADLYNPKKH